jgi:hypothetical protein
MTRERAICINCYTPLIYTLCFAGAEYYCLNCGETFGMFDVSARELTKGEIIKLKVMIKVWTTLYRNMIPRSAYTKSNCGKCKIQRDHNLHLNKEEIIRDKIASKMLNKLKGFYGKES